MEREGRRGLEIEGHRECLELSLWGVGNGSKSEHTGLYLGPLWLRIMHFKCCPSAKKLYILAGPSAEGLPYTDCKFPCVYIK